MEETLSNDRMISYHRQQINPIPYKPSILTFAYEGGKYGKKQLWHVLILVREIQPLITKQG